MPRMLVMESGMGLIQVIPIFQPIPILLVGAFSAVHVYPFGRSKDIGRKANAVSRGTKQARLLAITVKPVKSRFD